MKMMHGTVCALTQYVVICYMYSIHVFNLKKKTHIYFFLTTKSLMNACM